MWAVRCSDDCVEAAVVHRERLEILGALLVVSTIALVWTVRGRSPAGRPVEGTTVQLDADTSVPLYVARPGLRAQATVTPAQAWQTASASLGEGEALWAVLEPLSGRLVYVLIFRGKDELLDEMIVDARSGALLSARLKP
jgi:hypothetical protein